MAKNSEPSAQNGLDPDLAELLSIEEATSPDGEGPDFRTLFKEESLQASAAGGEPPDTTKKRFAPITKIQENPKPFFQDKDYYKCALAGEGDCGQRVHDLLGKFMKATDVEEKSKLRAQVISAYWELAASIAGHVGKDLPVPKRLLLRFGILSPTFLTAELRDMVSRIVFENVTGEPIWYCDEWLERVAAGLIRPSSTDEVKKVQKDAGRKLVDEVEKKRGQREAELTLLRNKIGQLDERESDLRGQVEALLRHERREDFNGLKAPFTAAQKMAMSQIQEILRQLNSLDGQVSSSYVSLANMDKELETLARKTDGVNLDSVVDQKTVAQEFLSVRQMAKMSVGRKGNHFPIFLAQFVRPQIREIGIRENVISAMAQVEALDPELFMRTHKQQTTRIVPNTILLASYGETGEVQPRHKPGQDSHPHVPQEPPARGAHRPRGPALAGGQGKGRLLLDGRGHHGEILPVVHGPQAQGRRAGIFHPRLRHVDHQGEHRHAEAGPRGARDLLAPDAVPPADQGQPQEPGLCLQRAVQEGPEHRPIGRVLTLGRSRHKYRTISSIAFRGFSPFLW
jgi:hypothetical protein